MFSLALRPAFLQPEKVTTVMAVGSFELEPWEKVFPSFGPQLSFLVWRWTCVVVFLCKVSEKPAPWEFLLSLEPRVCVCVCTHALIFAHTPKLLKDIFLFTIA